MQDCPEVTNPAQGKDCVDVDSTGSTAMADAVIIANSELRHCYDRSVKSKNAAAIIRDSWVHNNLRGGAFAQSSNGKLKAERNLIEENAKNCPPARRARSR